MWWPLVHGSELETAAALRLSPAQLTSHRILRFDLAVDTLANQKSLSGLSSRVPVSHVSYLIYHQFINLSSITTSAVRSITIITAYKRL